MTWRQSFLKTLYPLVMRFSKSSVNGTVLINEKQFPSTESFYNLCATQNNGEKINFESFKGKKVLIVNTASDCGYTNQYDDLQKLYATKKDNLIIIGFPSNDFKEQENKSNADIAKFCKENYGVTFPVMLKSIVVKGIHQNEIFKWLTDKNKNGWNDQQPQWNFSKYLINEKGVLINYFGPAISPLGHEITNSIAN